MSNQIFDTFYSLYSLSLDQDEHCIIISISFQYKIADCN